MSLENGAITALEALTRIRLPLLGNVSPPRFVGITEAAGLSMYHTNWVLRSACAQAAKWQCSHRPLRICVNVSAHNLGKREFMHAVQAALQASGLYPSNLQIEITETMTIHSKPSIRGRLTDLRDLGIRIAIDDFGTGFSSLQTVLEIPADVVKLDRCFVRDLETSSKSRALIRSAVNMAHSLGMEIVAEGVETRPQRAFLQDAACDSMQGFLISPPVQLEGLPALMEARSRRPSGHRLENGRIRYPRIDVACPAA